MVNSNSAKAGSKHLIGGKERINVLQDRLSGVVLCVLWLCFVVFSQGTANAAATPEAASTQNAVMLNSTQPVSMLRANNPTNQPLAQGVNGSVELVALVPAQSNPVSPQKADQERDGRCCEGVKRLLGDDYKYLIHAAFWLFFGLVCGGAFGWPPGRK